MSQQLEGYERRELIWAVCLIIPQLLAIVSTIFRLIYRKRNQGLWWDDYLAAFSLVFAFMVFATTWLTFGQVRPTLHVASTLLATFSFPSLVWTTRISLALSIARIMPRQHPIFSVVLYLVFLFAAIALAIVIELMVTYVQDTSWMHTPPYAHSPNRAAEIFALCADLVGDILLISIPLRLFWHAKLLPIELFLVKIGFASSVLTSAFIITCAVFLLVPVDPGSSQIFLIQTGIMQIAAALSLLVCNALVIITFLYRYFRRHKEEEPSASPQMPATQVTHDQYPSTYGPCEFTSILPSSPESTYTSNIGYLHTFSNPESRPICLGGKSLGPREHPI